MAFEVNFLTANIAVVHGVTDGTGDTELSKLPPNPWNDTSVIALVVGGKGQVYVVDDGTDAPHQSGVLAATIDIRSALASESFVCLVIKLLSGEGFVYDHSAVTT